MRLRIRYTILALITIGVGLLVHLQGNVLGTAAQDITGDALYAMMIAWWVGVLVPDARLPSRSAISFAICATIEFSQLWHAPLLEAARATHIGRLVLGSGFDARDLAAYAVGIMMAAIVEKQVLRKILHSSD